MAFAPSRRIGLSCSLAARKLVLSSRTSRIALHSSLVDPKRDPILMILLLILLRAPLDVLVLGMQLELRFPSVHLRRRDRFVPSPVHQPPQILDRVGMIVRLRTPLLARLFQFREEGVPPRRSEDFQPFSGKNDDVVLDRFVVQVGDGAGFDEEDGVVVEPAFGQVERFGGGFGGGGELGVAPGTGAEEVDVACAFAGVCAAPAGQSREDSREGGSLTEVQGVDGTSDGDDGHFMSLLAQVLGDGL